MPKLLTTLLAVLIAAAPQAEADKAPAAATLTFPDRPELFVMVEPAEGPLRVQQQIVLRIRLVSAAPFEALSLSRPAGGSDVEILELSAPRTREVRSYAANGFSHEAHYALFPLRSGPLSIDEIRATGRVKGPGGETIAFDIASPSRQLDILAAPESWTEPWWMIADTVDVEERWSIPPERLRRGDVVRRTVTVSARGAPADRMAPPVHAAARGVEIHEVALETRTLRSPEGFTGVMERSWDIVIPDAPVVNIPPVRVAFWDAAGDAPAVRAAPGRRIEPAEPDREARAMALMAEAKAERSGARKATLFAALLLIAPALALAGAFAVASCPSRADLRLLAACRGVADPKTSLRAVDAWRRETGLRTDGCEHVRRLEAALYGGHTGAAPQAAALALLSVSRQARRAALTRRLRGASDALLGKAAELGEERTVFGPAGLKSVRRRRDTR